MQQGEDDRIDRIVGKIGEFNVSVQAPMLDFARRSFRAAVWLMG
jgi:hypothetical protein